MTMIDFDPFADENTHDSFPTYQRLLSSLGHDCMSKVEERVCLACRATLDMQAAGRVRRGEYLQCPGCGRMLYGMAEE